MKKIISVLLLTFILVMSLVGCGDKGGDFELGYYKADGVGYFIGSEGAVVVEGENAKASALTVDGENFKIGDKVVAKSSLEKADFVAPKASEEYFTYATKNGHKNIKGLTDLGKSAKILFVPSDVYGIETGALAGCSAKELVIGKGSHPVNIGNDAFKDSNLNVYIDGRVPVNELTCGNAMMTNTKGVTLYIGKDAYDAFKGDYTWGNFSSNMKSY